MNVLILIHLQDAPLGKFTFWQNQWRLRYSVCWNFARHLLIKEMQTADIVHLSLQYLTRYEAAFRTSVPF